MPEDPDYDACILNLSDDRRDDLTIRQAFEGIQIFGASGSGKTSGSGAALAIQMLRLGFGGLVLTVKGDEADSWTNPVNGYCVRAGRKDPPIVLSSDGRFKFDFLEYERSREGRGAGETLELARLFSTVLEAAGQGGSSPDAYWSRALSQLLTNTIDLAKFAFGNASLRVLADVVHEAPSTIEETKTEGWLDVVQAATSNAKTEAQRRDLQVTLDYFNHEFPRLNDRTRSSIVSMFTSMADQLLRGTIGGIFASGEVTVRPEDTHQGRLIIIDLPVKEYGEVGRMAQMIFKYVWQRSAERRTLQDPNEPPTAPKKPLRPIFLWCDESQELITGHDAAFQATARSSSVATVYLTQNLRNYHARLGGGAKAEAETDSLLGNLGTMIFHANGDPTTNQYAEKKFGYGPARKEGGSVTDGKPTVSWSEMVEPTVPAKRFTTLRKGSPSNDFEIECIVFQTGRTWAATSDNYLEHVFVQTKKAR